MLSVFDPLLLPIFTLLQHYPNTTHLLPLPQGNTTVLLPIYYPFALEMGSPGVAQVWPWYEPRVARVPFIAPGLKGNLMDRMDLLWI